MLLCTYLKNDEPSVIGLMMVDQGYLVTLGCESVESLDLSSFTVFLMTLDSCKGGAAVLLKNWEGSHE